MLNRAAMTSERVRGRLPTEATVRRRHRSQTVFIPPLQRGRRTVLRPGSRYVLSFLLSLLLPSFI